MSRDHDDVALAVQLRFGDRVLGQEYRFPLAHLQNIRRPANPLGSPSLDARDYWDFSTRTHLRQKLIDMIAINIAASIATAFDKEFE